MVGIISYGVYIPKYRIKTADIAQVWGKRSSDIQDSLGVKEKAVPAGDEDAVTQALEAGWSALKKINLPAEKIELLLVGSESHPYAVNPTSTSVGDLLGVGNNYLAADLEFACKAATAGLQLAIGLIASSQLNYALVIGTDTAQSKPHDSLEYTAGSGAAAVILGNKPKQVIAELQDFSSFSSDTPDFWRRDGVQFPSHGGRFTGKPAYLAHVWEAAKSLLAKTKLAPADFDYCVFHMPNLKFPQTIAKQLGFTPKQLAPSLVVSEIGNPYSASSLIGLASVLDIAKPGQTIFMVSYGSGAGSDAFVWQVTKAIKNYPRGQVKDLIKQKEYINYVEYLQKQKII